MAILRDAAEGKAQLKSNLEIWHDPIAHSGLHARLTLYEYDAMRMDREQLSMIEDGLWLIALALRGETEGPLTTPHGVPIRT